MYPTNADLPGSIDVLATRRGRGGRRRRQPHVVRAGHADATTSCEQNYAEVLARQRRRARQLRSGGDEHARVRARRARGAERAASCPNGRRTPPRPKELRGLDGPIIGYAGNLSARIDLALLETLGAGAAAIGTSCCVGSTHLDRSSAASLRVEPNVRFIGTKRYEDAQRIIAHFDVALIPHLDNEMTRSMNPLKAYVYCSLGVPVVSTRSPTSRELAEFITIARGANEFLVAIEQALRATRRRPHERSCCRSPGMCGSPVSWTSSTGRSSVADQTPEATVGTRPRKWCSTLPR